MRNFFVTGLPRSRTAWIANYLTWGKTFCFHDGFVGLAHPLEIRKKFDAIHAKGFETVGNSDPANLYFLDTLIKDFPDAYWVLIKRDLKECRESASQAFGHYSDLNFEQAQMKKLDDYLWERRVSGITLDFTCLDVHVMQGEFSRFVDSPPERTDLLLSMQIQLTSERLADRDLFDPQLLNHIDKNECILA